MTQFGVPFTLTGPDGTVAVFNDSTSPNYVGFLNDVSGLDSAEVRENFDDRVQGDGGVHGDFWYGRRPVVMQGFIDHTTTTDRNTKAEKLLRASNAMRGDATLVWTPDGGVARRLLLRRQQPVRITGAWNKQFLLPMVSANHLIESSVEHGYTMDFDTETSTIINNAGDHPVPAHLRLYGAVTNINEIENQTTGEALDFGGYDVSDGNFIEIDTGDRTVLLNNVTSVYGQLVFASTTWWFLEPGNNTIRLPAMGSFGANGRMDINWRDGWV